VAADPSALSREEFYAEFTRRNSGIVTPGQQQALSTATVLVAGCGSVGGAAVEPLVRLGVQDFVLAEPDTFELNNLNRQQAMFRDIGRNKAEVAAERILAINPHAQARVHADGVTQANAADLTSACDVIIDGVDVTTVAGWRAKHALHRSALERKLALVTGWDMAGVQYVQCYDYREVSEPFNGLVTEPESTG
jgi:tRNA A37 threonylcarbamoyladenosine dehydratase